MLEAARSKDQQGDQQQARHAGFQRDFEQVVVRVQRVDLLHRGDRLERRVDVAEGAQRRCPTGSQAFAASMP
jgi:hypothetical protein